MPQLFALLERSSCSLRTLEIPDFTCDTNVIECVQRIPTLRNIYFGPSLKGKVLPDQVSRILDERAASDTNSGKSEPLEVWSSEHYRYGASMIRFDLGSDIDAKFHYIAIPPVLARIMRNTWQRSS